MQSASESSLKDVRVEHVASLLRPQWLLDVYARHKAGTASDAELRDAQDCTFAAAIAAACTTVKAPMTQSRSVCLGR